MSVFDENFVWGVATSAHQIEGGWEDGRGASIWDEFPGLTGGDGRIACDHYHRFREDVSLLGQLGVNGYRFSIAWPRIVPEEGVVNQAGLDFYRRLCDELAEHDVVPYATLYHWDLPTWVQGHGGWLDRSVLEFFRHYVETVVEGLGDRVQHWMTHNEPWVASMLGHQTGDFAPGIADPSAGLAAAHHILVSHGESVPIIRENVRDAIVGIAVDCRPAAPADDSPEAMDAHRHFDGFRNRWFFDPIFGRGYPQDMVEDYAAAGRWDGSLVREGDLETIAAPLDFVGVNYYTSIEVAPGGGESEYSGVPPSDDPPPGYTEMGWAITPPALTEFLTRLRDTYQPPAIMITENGLSASGSPQDPERIAYLEAHIAAVGQAIEEGVPVSGYFVWSFLDNLEWTLGYAQRFGIVWVDFETLERTPKDSFWWYRDWIARVASR